MLRGMPFSNPLPSTRSDSFLQQSVTPLQSRLPGTRTSTAPVRQSSSTHSVALRASNSSQLRVRVIHAHRALASPFASQSPSSTRAARSPRHSSQPRTGRPLTASTQLGLLALARRVGASSTPTVPASSLQSSGTLDPPNIFGPALKPSERTLARAEMSFFNPLQTNYLSAKLQVCFDGEGTVDMLGGPNTGTSYSLPGHVVIVVPCLPHALDGRIREIQTLDVVLEGKSEFFDDEGRYTPMRLHTSKVHLVPRSAPFLVPASDPSRPKASHVHMVVPFDLRLPGWLPPSHRSGKTNTAHGVRVNATVGWHNASALESSFSPRKTLWTNTSMFPFATAESLSNFTEFTVRRHRFPSSFDRAPVPLRERQYSLRSDLNAASPIECIVTVPEWVDTHGDERSLRITLRLKARDLTKPVEVLATSATSGEETPLAHPVATEAQTTWDEGSRTTSDALSVPVEKTSLKSASDPASRTHLIEIGMEVEEVERYSSTAFPSFTSCFPIPANQPAGLSLQHALISPRSVSANPMENQYHNVAPFSANVTRQCLLAEDGNQRNFFFADNGLPLGEIWRKVNIVLPMPDQAGAADEYRNGGRPQAELDGAFLRIRHNLKIRIVCRPPGSTADTVVILSTPIRFGTSPYTAAKLCSNPLPAYIQLFHENGDLRECDPLPIYTQHPEAAENVAPPSSPVPDYKSLFPSAPSPSPSYTSYTGPLNHEAQSPPSPFRAPSPAGSSTSTSSDAMDLDPPTSHEQSSPNTSWIPSIPGGPVFKIQGPTQHATEGPSIV